MSHITPHKGSWGTPCRHWLSIWLLGLALCLCATGAQAKRVALLIGNAKYSAGALRTPPQDVREMSAALKAVGFTDVEVLLDANQNAMKRAVRDFGDKAEGAEMAFVYYSGHGTQAGGENYLIPIGATIEKESDYGIEAVSANEVLRQISGAKPKVAIVVLDACRDNPMSVSRSGTKGLGRMEAPSGTMIAFATAPNTTASDEGFYAKALAEQIRKPGQELIDVFRSTSAEVLQLSQGKQEPRISEVSINQKVYFLPAQQVASLDPVPAPDYKPSLPGKPSGSGVSLGDLERADKEVAQRKAQWAVWQKKMKADFDGVSHLSSAKTRQQGWQRFIEAYEGQDNPYSTEDEALLSQAKSLLAALQQAQAQQPVNEPPAARVAATTGPKAGSSFRDCADCPEMVWLPKGHFTMGSPSSEAERHDHEDPQHEVSINYDLAVGKFEVTFDEWAACVNGGGCTSKPNPGDQGWGRGRRPVINVSWDDAKEYVAWLSRKTGKRYRLLSEAEWEYAARAGTSTPFYTGACISTTQANYAGTYDYNGCGAKTGTYLKRTQEVGSYAPNAWGLYDMAGNVWQWVEDVYHDSYSGAPSDGAAWVSGGDQSLRVRRGGSWYDGPANLRSAVCYGFYPTYSDDDIGFRLARTN